MHTWGEAVYLVLYPSDLFASESNGWVLMGPIELLIRNQQGMNEVGGGSILGAAALNRPRDVDMGSLRQVTWHQHCGLRRCTGLVLRGCGRYPWLCYWLVARCGLVRFPYFSPMPCVMNPPEKWEWFWAIEHLPQRHLSQVWCDWPCVWFHSKASNKLYSFI